MYILNYPGCLGDLNYALLRSIEILKNKRVKTIASPFLTGGYFELAFAKNGISVLASSDSQHIIDFWATIKQDAKKVVSIIYDMLEKGKGSRHYFAGQLFLRYDVVDIFEKTALNIILNRLSVNGGSMRPDNKNQRLSNYESVGTTLYKKNAQNQLRFECDFSELAELPVGNVSIEKLSTNDFFEKHNDNYMFIYPPSMMYPKCVQGETPAHMEEFDHDALHKTILQHNDLIFLAEDNIAVKRLFNTYSYTAESAEVISSAKVTDTYDLLLIVR